MGFVVVVFCFVFVSLLFLFYFFPFLSSVFQQQNKTYQKSLFLSLVSFCLSLFVCLFVYFCFVSSFSLTCSGISRLELVVSYIQEHKK